MYLIAAHFDFHTLSAPLDPWVQANEFRPNLKNFCRVKACTNEHK